MQYDGLAWFTGLLALLALFIAARILFAPNWFLAWLRGTAGLAFLALALLIGVIAYDLRSYDPQVQDKPLVTLSFSADGPQRYRVNLLEGGEEREVTLEGDLWQLDARLLGWKGLAALIGLQPGYRLEKLSGRFLAIEQQQSARFARVALAAPGPARSVPVRAAGRACHLPADCRWRGFQRQPGPDRADGAADESGRAAGAQGLVRRASAD